MIDVETKRRLSETYHASLVLLFMSKSLRPSPKDFDLILKKNEMSNKIFWINVGTSIDADSTKI